MNDLLREPEGTMDALKRQLIKHEGVSRTVYLCAAGMRTIGVGRNLDRSGGGLSEDEVEYLLNNDIRTTVDAVNRKFPIVKDLSENRRVALYDMAFNLGVKGLRRFKKMWKALECHNYNTAAYEMMDSRWSQQVGKRAKTLEMMMRLG